MALTSLMTKEITSLPAHATATDAAKYMFEMNVGSVIITDDSNKPIGILTDRDIVSKVIGPEKDPKTVKIKDIMTSPVVTVPVDKDIIDATKIMCAHGIRRFAVVDSGGKLAGVLTLDDILILLGQEIQHIAAALKREIGK
ncbi:MAG: CBS domain-containing protein [Nitrospirae bacterium]|nr:CBS domain-containing protein [Nitrospirota bacterium]